MVPLHCALAKPQPAWTAVVVWLCVHRTVHDAALPDLAGFAVRSKIASQVVSLSSQRPADRPAPAAGMAPFPCAPHRCLPGERQLAACVAHCSDGCWRLCCSPATAQTHYLSLPGRYSMACAFSVLSQPCRALHC